MTLWGDNAIRWNMRSDTARRRGENRGGRGERGKEERGRPKGKTDTETEKQYHWLSKVKGTCLFFLGGRRNHTLRDLEDREWSWLLSPFKKLSFFSLL